MRTHQIILGSFFAFILPLSSFAEEETKWFVDELPVHAFYIGGGGNVGITDSDAIDTIAGGSVLVRYTYRGLVSAQTSLDFNRFPIQDTNFDGDIFSTPLLGSLMIHSPISNNLSLYFLGGVGYQYNDADDAVADLTRLGFPGVEIDAEVNDGFIVAAGAGLDVMLSDHFFFNFEVRFQFADFDIEADAVLPGGAFVSVEENESFDTLYIRTALLYRF